MEAVWLAGSAPSTALTSEAVVGSAVAIDAAVVVLILFMQMSVAWLPLVLQWVHSILLLSAWQLAFRCLSDPQMKQRPSQFGRVVFHHDLPLSG